MSTNNGALGTVTQALSAGVGALKGWMGLDGTPQNTATATANAFPEQYVPTNPNTAAMVAANAQAANTTGTYSSSSFMSSKMAWIVGGLALAGVVVLAVRR